MERNYHQKYNREILLMNLVNNLVNKYVLGMLDILSTFDSLRYENMIKFYYKSNISS